MSPIDVATWPVAGDTTLVEVMPICMYGQLYIICVAAS